MGVHAMQAITSRGSLLAWAGGLGDPKNVGSITRDKIIAITYYFAVSSLRNVPGFVGRPTD